MMIDSWQTAREIEPELVIYHPKALGGPSIAEKFGAPAYMAVLQPMYVPTLICSFMGDQPFWGGQVFEMGLGPESIYA